VHSKAQSGSRLFVSVLRVTKIKSGLNDRRRKQTLAETNKISFQMSNSHSTKIECSSY